MDKILVIGPGPETRGGITSVIREHSKTNAWENWNCKWISSYIDKNNFFKLWFFIKGYTEFLYNLRSTSMVHIHFSEPMSAFRKLFFFETAKLFGKKIIIHFHAFSPESTLNGPISNIYKRLFNTADSVIALSNYWKNEITNVTINPDKISVLYNPCSRIKLKNEVKSKSILFAGTLNERKGYSDLIIAFSKVSHKYPKWRLIFAGNGEIEKAKDLAERYNILERVDFKGWVSGKEKDALFRSASIFCLPSYAEGFPMAVLDAWAYGLPVLTTPVGGLPDIIKKGENALVFDPGDLKTLAGHLEELISSPSFRFKLEKKSLILARDVFDIGVIGQNLDKIYTSVGELKKSKSSHPTLNSEY